MLAPGFHGTILPASARVNTAMPQIQEEAIFIPLLEKTSYFRQRI
jgi:hypothetical protein